MNFTISAGTSVAIASAYGAAKTMSAISNASEAVATLEASHGIVVDDVIEITSGWPALSGQLARVKTVATNDVTLELIDTSSTTQFPAGSGAGSVRKVSTWQSLGQIDADISSSGGEQQFRQIRLLSQLEEIELPTTRTATRLTLPYYDDPTAAWQAVVKAARDAKSPRGVRLSYPNGYITYGNGYWGMPDFATPRDGVLGGDITVNMSARANTYTS